MAIPKHKPITPRRACFNCAETLPQAAKYCTHCSTYQDWRKYLPFSSTVLSLLVALLAVLGTTVPVIKTALESENPELRASLVFRDILPLQHGDDKESIQQRDVFQIALSNDGTGVAIVTSMLIWYEFRPREKSDVEGENIKNELARLPLAYINRQDYKIKPKDSIILPFFVESGVVPDHNIRLEIYYVTTKHEQKHITIIKGPPKA